MSIKQGVCKLTRVILLCFLKIVPSYAQSTAQTETLEELLEHAAEQTQEENSDQNPLLEDLLFYSLHPVALNRAKKEELQAIRLLSDIQIAQLLSHIEKNGQLLTIYELQAIEGFDLLTIQKLLPYVYLDTANITSLLNRTGFLKNAEQTVVLRLGQVLEKQKGYSPIDSLAQYKSPNSRYIGSPQKIFAAYRFKGKNVSMGLITEKDPGELFFKQHSGFDFYSAHAFIHDATTKKAVAIGDYTISFGQGLTAWSGNSLGKSVEMLYAKKSAGGIRPSTSADENRFMRGIAASYNIRKIKGTFFYSRKRIDAKVSDTLENGEPAAISSLQQSGIHSTPSEIQGKHAVLQTLYGGNLNYSGNRASMGLTFIHDQLHLPFQSSPGFDDEKSKQQQFSTGLDYQFIVRNFLFFGETAMSDNTGIALLNGVFISLDPRLGITVLHRYYGGTYQNRFSTSFGESGSSNEKGLYMGITANLTRFISINACFDRFEFPWLKYQVDAPSKGNDLNAQLSYLPSKKLSAVFRYRKRYQQKNTRNEIPLRYLSSVHSENYRFSISYSGTKELTLRNRIELMRYKREAETQTGYLIYQDIFYKPGSSFSATLRYALFQTDSYDSRLYEYENDIPGSYSIPSFYDRGSRSYILLNYSVTKYVEMWLRYAQTFYDNKEVISEGSLSEIQGNTKSDIKVGVKVKW